MISVVGIATDAALTSDILRFNRSHFVQKNSGRNQEAKKKDALSLSRPTLAFYAFDPVVEPMRSIAATRSRFEARRRMCFSRDVFPILEMTRRIEITTLEWFHACLSARGCSRNRKIVLSFVLGRISDLRSADSSLPLVLILDLTGNERNTRTAQGGESPPRPSARFLLTFSALARRRFSAWIARLAR